MKIDRVTELELRRDLAAVIGPVIDQLEGQGRLPALGPGTAAYMADAAVALLLALDDAQAQMQRDGLLSEE